MAGIEENRSLARLCVRYGVAENVRLSQEAGFAEHVTKPVSNSVAVCGVNRVAIVSADHTR